MNNPSVEILKPNTLCDTIYDVGRVIVVKQCRCTVRDDIHYNCKKELNHTYISVYSHEELKPVKD